MGTGLFASGPVSQAVFRICSNNTNKKNLVKRGFFIKKNNLFKKNFVSLHHNTLKGSTTIMLHYKDIKRDIMGTLTHYITSVYCCH